MLPQRARVEAARALLFFLKASAILYGREDPTNL